jgi:hypothetical protein
MDRSGPVNLSCRRHRADGGPTVCNRTANALTCKPLEKARFAGIFNEINNIGQLPKLSVEGSIPFARSNDSKDLRRIPRLISTLRPELYFDSRAIEAFLDPSPPLRSGTPPLMIRTLDVEPSRLRRAMP